MKGTILLLSIMLTVSISEATADCSGTYLRASKRKVNYFSKIGKLFSFKEYRRYTETTFGAVATYPIMLAAATIATTTAIPISQVGANVKSRYQRKMGEFLGNIDGDSGFKRRLYRKVQRKVEITDVELNSIIKTLNKTAFFCAVKSTPQLTDAGIEYLSSRGYRSIMELYSMEDDRAVIDGFWDNLSHFRIANGYSVSKKRENERRLIEYLETL